MRDEKMAAGLVGWLVDRVAPFFAYAFLASMAVLIFEIIARHLFNSPTLWAHETTTFLCAISFVFGGLYCLRHDQHIRVALLYDRLAGRAKLILDRLLYALVALAAGFFSWASYLMVQKSWFTPSGAWRLETSGSAWNPPLPALLKGFLLLVMLLMLIQALRLLCKPAKAAPLPEEGPSPS